MQKLQQKQHCDPIALGANCPNCPLYDTERQRHLARPVPGEVRKAKLAILAEAPGRNEEYRGSPLVGASGRLVESGLKAIGLSRSDVSIHNTLLCRPPKDFKPEQWRQAIEACRPRLEKELQEASSQVIFAAGNRALQATVGKASVTPWYGALLPSRYGPVFPSVHPAFALRKTAMIPVFKRWLSRAYYLASGALKSWQWGELVVADNAPVAQTMQRLLDMQQPIGIDVENTGDPLNSDMLCVGLANEHLAVSFDWKRLKEPEIEAAFRAILPSALPKIGHNFQHDILALKYKGYEITGPIHDTLLLHAVLAPQLRHSLTNVAAFETIAPRWKTEFATGSEDKGVAKFANADPLKLRTYNAKDAMMTARLFTLLMAQL